MIIAGKNTYFKGECKMFDYELERAVYNAVETLNTDIDEYCEGNYVNKREAVYAAYEKLLKICFDKLGTERTRTIIKEVGII